MEETKQDIFDRVRTTAAAHGNQLSIAKTWKLVKKIQQGVTDPDLAGRTDYADPTGNTAVHNIARTS